MTEFLIGADPELFVRKDGQLVSAYGLIPGTKEAPFKVAGGAVQVDGMALEFNIDPAATFEQFNDNIESVLGELKKMVGPDYEFDFSPVADFGKEYIEAQPEKAKELGCDPDYSAYTGLANPKPSGDLGIRTASGHIHIGWTKDQDVTDIDHIEACQMVTKQLDASLGAVARVWDRDTTRRQMYGDFGAYRPKSYGVEYRTPSNVWVADIRTRQLTFDLALTAVTKLLEGKQFWEMWNVKNITAGWGPGDIFSEVSYQLTRQHIITNSQNDILRSLYEEAEAKQYAGIKKTKVKAAKMARYADVAIPPLVVREQIARDVVFEDEWARIAADMAAPRRAPHHEWRAIGNPLVEFRDGLEEL